jgi:hypothetical protein
VAVYDLQPEDVDFSDPITLTVVADVTSLNPRQRDRITLYSYEDTESAFVPIPGALCVIIENPPGVFTATCTGSLSHFSLYAIVAPLDTDNDGLPDLFPPEDEAAFGTNPQISDTDGDGLLDGQEVDLAQGTGCPSPTNSDSDDDGELDGAEFNAGADLCNHPPEAENDSATVVEDGSVEIDIQANDSAGPPDEDQALATTQVSDPAHGAAGINGNDKVSYVPDEDYCGDDSFTYTVGDREPLCTSATVTVGVTCVNDPPVAENDSATVDEDGSVEIGVQANDSAGPPNEDPELTTTQASDPAHGAATINQGDTITYEPDADYCGDDSLSYEVCDSESLCDTATVSVTVECISDPPVISEIGLRSQSVQYSDRVQPVSISAFDVDEDQLEIGVVDLPDGLSLTGECSSGSCFAEIAGQVLAPSAAVTPTVTITDTVSITATATISVTVRAEDALLAFDPWNRDHAVGEWHGGG